MSEDTNPLKEAVKAFAGVNDQEEIARVRSHDDDADLQGVDVPKSAVPSAEALDNDGVIDGGSAQVSGGAEKK
jgi:hypothetical protein